MIYDYKHLIKLQHIHYGINAYKAYESEMLALNKK